jgi:hypothetical protein
MSYRETGDVENKISPGSLNNGTARIGELWADLPGLKRFLGIEFSKGGSEKGSSRKHTENRVTRWRIKFWRNLAFLR